ncbi:hypothetical protein HDU83_000256 [Entophlyctis luteolus]|nr:hypothetical protein HDU83_000256 [Entophlyctis luteolus]
MANAQTGIVTLSNGLTGPMLVHMHVILMSLSLLALPSVGVFVAMFLRERLGWKWTRVHLGIVISVGVLSAGSGILMILLKPGQMMCSMHEKLGAVILGLAVVETLIILAEMWCADGSAFVAAQFHKYFGLVLVYLVVPAQVVFGFFQYSAVFGKRVPLWLAAVPTGLLATSIASLAIGFFVFRDRDSLGLYQSIRADTRGGVIELAETSRNTVYSPADFESNSGSGDKSQTRHNESRTTSTTQDGDGFTSGQSGVTGARESIEERCVAYGPDCWQNCNGAHVGPHKSHSGCDLSNPAPRLGLTDERETRVPGRASPDDGWRQ